MRYAHLAILVLSLSACPLAGCDGQQPPRSPDELEALVHCNADALRPAVGVAYDAVELGQRLASGDVSLAQILDAVRPALSVAKKLEKDLRACNAAPPAPDAGASPAE